MASRKSPQPVYRKIVADLRESEERYRNLVEGVKRYAIFMLDSDGVILTWNHGIYELFGYLREDIIGRSGALLFAHEENAAEAFADDISEATKRGEAIRDRFILRKDGKTIRVTDVTTALNNSAGDLIGFAKVAHPVVIGSRPTSQETAVQLAKALATIQIEVEHRHRLEAALLTAIEQERERLGRDLHDDLAQRLAAIALMTQAAAKKISARAPTQGKRIREIARLMQDASGASRDLARGLHPVTIAAQGLPAALEELASRVPKKIQFAWPRTKRLALDPAVALHAYRIAEEAVWNAIKHSGADKITIGLDPISPRSALLSISDNGKGFPAQTRQTGMGMQNMKYRAGVLKSSLNVKSSSKGTTISCKLILEAI
jgi:PAS domain S-box-containing protein